MLPLSAVLLVDDDPTTNFLHQRLLRRLNVAREVLVALNGEQALHVLKQQCQQAATACPALVLLDVNMPVMNGFEFLEVFSHLTLAHRQDIVVVMLTTSLLDQDLVRAQQLPVADFLNKPLTTEKLMEVLQRYFSNGHPDATA